MLRRMLDAHRELAMTRETHWIPELLQRTGLAPRDAVTPDLIRALTEHPKFANLGMTPEEVASLADYDGDLSYSGFVTRLFDDYGKRQGKSLVGDKTPSYVRDISVLNVLWPRAKYVHLIRDGRDVCLSLVAWDRAQRNVGRFSTWTEDPISTAALYWEWSVRLGREAAATLPPGLYFEARYETIVADPRAACECLCGFLDLSFDDAMVRYHEGRTRTKPGLDAKHAWLPPTPGLRDWRSDMDLDDLERFEAVAGALLDELGYERAALDSNPEAVAAASHKRKAFMADLRARGRPLPRRWLLIEEQPAIR
jgi:hypothetical protein